MPYLLFIQGVKKLIDCDKEEIIIFLRYAIKYKDQVTRWTNTVIRIRITLSVCKKLVILFSL